MFIPWLFSNQCSMCVKQKSKAKVCGEKAVIVQFMFYLYSALAVEGRPSFDIYLL